MISKIDINNYEVIRRNVDELLHSTSLRFDLDNILILDIAPHTHCGAKKFFKKAKVQTLDIDPSSNADYICDLAYAHIISNQKFDIIFCTEVLEHTNDPFVCVQTLYRILKPNGTVYVTTPFDFRIHNPLPDNWRFTEHGLRILFKMFGKVNITPIENKERFLMPIQYILEAQK